MIADWPRLSDALLAKSLTTRSTAISSGLAT